MDPDSKTLNEWRLHIAISQAQSDTREAPWYGPWDIILRDFLFSPFCKPPYFTITYPQFPVSKNVDTDNADDNDYDYYDDEDSLQMAQSTNRAAAPSPENFRGSRSLLPPTPSPPPPPPTQRTTRIPDFIQLLYQIRCNPDGTIPSPIEYTSRIILLVEIKRSTLNPTVKLFADILYQADHQARHTFHTSPNTDGLGVILAIGPFWTYVEYHRTDLRPSPSLSEKKDLTYEDNTPPPRKSFMKEYPPFAAHIHSTGHSSLCLETEESKKGLLIVRKRLRELNDPHVSN
jgi:hypothetical protein